jgi:hypothetical protein
MARRIGAAAASAAHPLGCHEAGRLICSRLPLAGTRQRYGEVIGFPA